ncbi:MAG: hypothetical protein ACM3XN_08490 [Chloroflexota bacterium]
MGQPTIAGDLAVLRSIAVAAQIFLLIGTGLLLFATAQQTPYFEAEAARIRQMQQEIDQLKRRLGVTPGDMPY